MQNNTSTRRLSLFIYECYKYEGIYGFYKGMAFPLASVSLVNALLFSANELSKKAFGFYNEDSLIEGNIIL